MMNTQKRQFCQSCAMPMATSELFGTDSDGKKTDEFCMYCFQNGQFTVPGITMQEMIDTCVAIMSQQNIMDENQARDYLTKTIPHLKRWRSA